MGKPKKPGFGAIVADLKKQARVQLDPDLFKALPPAWHVGRLDFEGPFSWSQITTEDLHTLRDRLKGLESMRWNELDADRDDHHSLLLEKCSKPARDRADELQIGDEKIFSVHITGKKRAHGIRIGNVLSFLWWDPEHEVFPSSKKNT